MAKEAQLHSDMAHARQSEGINVIFDQNSPDSSSSRSRSRSRSTAGSSDSSAHTGRVHRRRRHRSSSSSTSSSSSRARSRSYPRCRRRSSRCRCSDHHRYGRGYYRRSPSRRHRAHSRSYSRSLSPDRSSRGRHYRSHHRSTSRSQSRSLPHSSRYRRSESHYRYGVSSPRSQRSRSRSRSTGHSISLSQTEKPDVPVAANENVEMLLEVKTVDLPESVAPAEPEQLSKSESMQSSPEPELWVRPSPEKTPSQSDGDEPEDNSSLQWSHRPIISFSINNSMARPSLAAPPCAKVTPQVDSYESRTPYGHWIPVKSVQRSHARKRRAVKSR